MARHSDDQPDDLLGALIGLGEKSVRKSYYPQLRQRLAELERFRLLFDQGNDLILLAAMPSRQILDVNNPLCAFLGAEPAEIKAMRLDELLPPGTIAAIAGLGADQHPIHTNTIFCRRDSRVVPVEMTCRMAETDGTACVLLVARDISERFRFESELRQAKEEAERASLAKSRFLAAASHDLRQPFQAMALYYEVLSGLLTDPRQRQALSLLGSAMGGGQELLSALLDVSTLEAGIVTPKIATVPLAGLLSALHEEFADQVGVQGLRFRCVPSSYSVLTDQALLTRMLRNLLTNALKYTSSGSVLVGCRRQGNKVRVEVWDTGPGIPDQKFEDIWEDFVQLGNPERDRSKGLGLGLSIVARTAKLLGHRVGLKSKVGQGSVFWVELPLAGGSQEMRKAAG